MNKLTQYYPHDAYILYSFHLIHGKLSTTVPNPQICFTGLPAIQKLVGEANDLLSKSTNGAEVFSQYAALVPIHLEDVCPYDEKRWQNSSLLRRSGEVMLDCIPILLDDYKSYRVVVTPCVNPRNPAHIDLTVESVFKPTHDRLVWYTLPHSQTPLEPGTKQLGIYTCGKPMNFNVADGSIVENK